LGRVPEGGERLGRRLGGEVSRNLPYKKLIGIMSLVKTMP
jgi:hypothetical protein